MDSFNFSNKITGPKSDDNHQITQIEVLFGNNEYETNKIVSVHKYQTTQLEKKLKTPNKLNGVGGLIIHLYSSLGYKWTRTLLEHEGLIFTEDKVVED